MSQANMFILYVAEVEASVRFYRDLLERAPIEQSPNFAMFALDAGAMLGLWAKHDVEPAPTAPGGTELGILTDDDASVERLHRQWQTRGWKIAQAPTRMDFGFTFVALDPDSHRVRVFKPAA